jgi:hypothetical protein
VEQKQFAGGNLCQASIEMTLFMGNAICCEQGV